MHFLQLSHLQRVRFPHLNLERPDRLLFLSVCRGYLNFPCSCLAFASEQNIQAFHSVLPVSDPVLNGLDRLFVFIHMFPCTEPRRFPGRFIHSDGELFRVLHFRVETDVMEDRVGNTNRGIRNQAQRNSAVLSRRFRPERRRTQQPYDSQQHAGRPPYHLCHIPAFLL